MTVSERQQHLIQQIPLIKDEDILTMLEDELSYHLHPERDITDELTPTELEELKLLASETTHENTVSLDEFKKATDRWRTK
jgi:hypothetical protein